MSDRNSKLKTVKSYVTPSIRIGRLSNNDFKFYLKVLLTCAPSREELSVRHVFLILSLNKIYSFELGFKTVFIHSRKSVTFRSLFSINR